MEITFKSNITKHKVFMKISKDISLIPKYITNMINYYRLNSKQSREISVLEVTFIS